MNEELEMTANRLMQASTPEEVFGEIKAQYDEMLFLLQKNYRAIAKVVHPDRYHTLQEQILAQRTFILLTDWLDKAKEKVKSGEYGKNVDPPKTILRTRKREYSIYGSYVQDRMFNLYPCSFTEAGRVHQAVLKIVRDWHDNGLVEKEARALQTLSRGKDAEQLSAYLPNLIDTFVYEGAGVDRQAVILERYDGWYSLEDVHTAYPRGIDPKDMAWMWRRLLVVLEFSHTNRILHGAVLPRNIWIHPQKHGLMLVNWNLAVFDPLTTGERIQAPAPEDAGWYPQEVWIGQIPSFGTDIHMSAKCMLWLLGGDPQKKVFPESVPAPLKAFLKGCILPDRRAPQNAWNLKEEFDELLGRLWGERKFHPFSMK
jgi:hypothetical protein